MFRPAPASASRRSSGKAGSRRHHRANYTRAHASSSARLRPAPVALETTRATRHAWLVKVPKWLAEHWRSLPPTAPLGRLVPHTARSPAPPTPSGDGAQLTLDLSISSPPSDMPRDLLLNVLSCCTPTEKNSDAASSTLLSLASAAPGLISPDSGRTFVFDGDSRNGVATEITARIVADVQVMPVINNKYTTMLKSRTARATVPERTVKFVPLSEVARLRGSGFAAESRDETFAPVYIKQKVPEKAKKERLPHRHLVQQLMVLFQEYPYWSLKNLVERTQQPQMYLKEVLLQVGHLNKRGPYAGLYSVLPSCSLLSAAQTTGEESGAGEDEAVEKNALVENNEANTDFDDNDYFENPSSQELNSREY